MEDFLDFAMPHYTQYDAKVDSLDLKLDPPSYRGPRFKMLEEFFKDLDVGFRGNNYSQFTSPSDRYF